MKFRYIGDPNKQTPEGINHGPLYNRSYGYEWKKHETVIDVPDDALICDSAGRPARPATLICKKLLHNSHFELVQDEKQVDVVSDPEPRQKRKYTRRKPLNEPESDGSAAEGSAAA